MRWEPELNASNAACVPDVRAGDLPRPAPYSRPRTTVHNPWCKRRRGCVGRRSRLSARVDFQEGVACAAGGKKGQPPQWPPPRLDAAATDAAEWSLDGAREAKLRLFAEGRLGLKCTRDELLSQ